MAEDAAALAPATGDRSAVSRLGAQRTLFQDRERALRYSRFVGRAKLILPTGAAVLLLALATWPYLASNVDRLRLALPKIDLTKVRDLRMINPRYNGIDKDKRPFTLTADAARETSENADLLGLDAPKANILTQEGAWVVVTGDTGVYQQQTPFLDLFGHVTLFHDKGYQFTTTSARVDLDGGTADGKEPISGAGPSGTVAGQGFSILQKGDTVIFTGKSKLIMNAATAHDPSDDGGKPQKQKKPAAKGGAKQ
jgi:lipopolysaccharide export system protein LptC